MSPRYYFISGIIVVVLTIIISWWEQKTSVKEFFFVFCRVVILMFILLCMVVGFSELLVYLDIAQDGFVIKRDEFIIQREGVKWQAGLEFSTIITLVMFLSCLGMIFSWWCWFIHHSCTTTRIIIKGIVKNLGFKCSSGVGIAGWIFFMVIM